MDLRTNNSARCAGGRGEHFNLQIVGTGDFHTAIVENLGAVSDQTKHFFVADLRKTLGIGVTAGIPVIDAVNIRKYLA